MKKIEELVALLKQKEAEEAELSQRLVAAGERVLAVRETFAPRKRKLEENQQLCALREADCNARQVCGCVCMCVCMRTCIYGAYIHRRYSICVSMCIH